MKFDSYEDLRRGLEALPITWYPDLLRHLISIAYRKNIFKPGGLLVFVKNVIAAYEPGESMTDATTKQQLPAPGKIDVLPHVLKDLHGRNRIGTKKYGTTLQTNNGRSALWDAYQEALDLVMYLRQEILEREVPNAS